MQIKKADQYKQIVYGEVYAPGVPDSDGEYMTEETIEKMAHAFMRKSRLQQIDTNHNNTLVPGAMVVESFIARKGDPDFIPGSWVAGVHIPDQATWGQVLSGEINGFSVEALVVKRPNQPIELELPPVITGKTEKVQDHVHEFFVSYDDHGLFQGGRTDTVNGHSHHIRRGTLTEQAEGHSHRFSFIELLQR